MMLSEVNNTFGETHNYWLTPEKRTAQTPPASVTSLPSAMHVSSFPPMDLDYDWIFTPPGEQLVAHMNTLRERPPEFLMPRSSWKRRPWESREVLKALAALSPD